MILGRGLALTAAAATACLGADVTCAARQISFSEKFLNR
jgi:hypothetical protein